MSPSMRRTLVSRPWAVWRLAAAGWLALLVPQAGLAQTGLAQTGTGEPLTLAAAIDRAFLVNPVVAAARLRRPIDAARLAVAAEHPNPEMSIEFEKETPRQSYGVSVPLELGGKRGRRIAAGEAALLTGDAELAAAMAQVRNDVRRAYFGLHVASAKREAFVELRDLAQRARDAAQLRFDRGDTARLDVLQAELALDTTQNDVTVADGAVQAARFTLNALLALPLGTLVLLATPMDAGEPVVAAAVLDRARQTSTELILLDRMIDEQRAAAALARALRVPDAVPSATLTHGAEPEFTYGWRAAVAITLPLFTRHDAAVHVEDATLAQLTARRQAALLRIEGEVSAAAATAEAQRLAYVRFRDTILPQTQQVAALADESYRAGQTNLAALLQVLQASRELRLRSLDIIAEFQNAMTDLERAAGVALP
jgi:cobalt-zinc-cadmium efflux system outer membrane protein